MKTPYFAISILFCLSIPAFAGSTEKDGYTLTVSKEDPACTPNVAALNKENVKAYFLCRIEKKVANRMEDATADVKTADYTVSLPKGTGKLAKCSPFWIGVTSQNFPYSYGSTSFKSSVTPEIKPTVAGEFQVKLIVSVTLENGLKLNASETIDFKVGDYTLTIHVFPGNLPAKGYIINVNTMSVAGYLLSSDFGHSGWEFKTNDTSTLTWTQYGYVNTICGFGATAFGILQLASSARNYVTGGVPPFGAGDMITNDTTGFTVHKSFAVDLALLKKGLDHTKNIDDTWSVYYTGSNNCTDAAINASSAVGIVLPDCRKKITFKFSTL